MLHRLAEISQAVAEPLSRVVDLISDVRDDVHNAAANLLDDLAPLRDS